MNYQLINKQTVLNDMQQIFYNRGIPLTQINDYLNPRYENTLSPLLLGNIEEGAKLLIRHISLGNPVGILVDCDCDGFTSSALLINYLTELFPAWAKNRIVYYLHEDKTHGLSDSINKIIHSGVSLVIVPDAGGGDGIYAQQLKEVGIDTLIIDHHETTYNSCAPAIVINNQLENYPNPTLSGVGVVYKFCEYIDSLLGKNYASKFLDLVAVGCIADLMPLKNLETLYYIQEGLNHLNNPFIVAMRTAQDYSISKHGGELNPFTVGFYIAPFINATIRCGTEQEKLLIFESMLSEKGKELVPSGKRGAKNTFVEKAEEACRVSSNIKARQNKIRDEKLDVIEDLINKQWNKEDPVIIVRITHEYNMNKEILGLIANILVNKYQRPIMLLNETEEDGVPCWAGSCRNYQYSEIENFRNVIENIPESNYASGHASAFGASVPQNKFYDFQQHLNEELKDIDFTAMYRVDFQFNYHASFSDTIFTICNLKKYYGQGFQEPYIAITGIRCNNENVQLLSKDKNPTLKITLPNGVSLMKFKSSEEEYNSIVKNNHLETSIDVVGKCEINYWNGTAYPQVIIEDYNKTELTKIYGF